MNSFFESWISRVVSAPVFTHISKLRQKIILKEGPIFISMLNFAEVLNHSAILYYVVRMISLGKFNDLIHQLVGHSSLRMSKVIPKNKVNMICSVSFTAIESVLVNLLRKILRLISLVCLHKTHSGTTIKQFKPLR